MEGQNILNEITAVLSKVWTFLLLILLGMIGMFSYNMHTRRKMTFWQACGLFGLSLFVGTLTSILCYVMGWDRMSNIIVPFATLLSDKIMVAVFSINWEVGIRKSLLNYLKKKDGDWDK